MNRTDIGSLAGAGRFGDTVVAGVTRPQRRFLRQRGGAGTRNPRTGLQEYYDSVASGEEDANTGVTTGNAVSQTDAQAAENDAQSGIADAGANVANEAALASLQNTPPQQLGLALGMGPNQQQGVFGGPASLFNPTPQEVPLSLIALSPMGMVVRGMAALAQLDPNNSMGPPAGSQDTSTAQDADAFAALQQGSTPVATPYGVVYQPTSGMAMQGMHGVGMAKGGLAHLVRGEGRYGDTELVHMNPEELAALSERWGPPTTNPETGLPEFFSLGKLLKSVASVAVPAAATILTGNPLWGAAASTGLGLLTGKSPVEALGSGLLSYGLGKLGEGVNLSGEGGFFDSGRIGSISGDFDRFLDPFGSQSGLASLASDMPSSWEGQDFSAGGSYWQDAVPPPPLPKPSEESWWDRNKGAVLLGGGVLGAGLMGGNGPQAATSASVPSQPQQPAPQWRLERVYTPGGGPGHDYFQDVWVNDETGERRPMAHGGLATLAQGGSVNGPGGGQDDLIPAMLSDGEYVLPADVVSDLGDGSTQAGAKKLDQLRDGVRSHRRKGTRFPPKARGALSYLGGR